MEAMWTRFIPAIVTLREVLAAGVIGEPVYLTADLGSEATRDPDGRVFNPDLGDGAALQKGGFLVSLASMMFGPPNEVKSLGHLGPSAVDEHAAIILGYPEQRLAVLLCSVRTRTAREAVIVGSRGTIRIHSPVLRPTRLTITHHPDPRDRGVRAGDPLQTASRMVSSKQANTITGYDGQENISGRWERPESTAFEPGA